MYVYIYTRQMPVANCNSNLNRDSLCLDCWEILSTNTKLQNISLVSVALAQRILEKRIIYKEPCLQRRFLAERLARTIPWKENYTTAFSGDEIWNFLQPGSRHTKKYRSWNSLSPHPFQYNIFQSHICFESQVVVEGVNLNFRARHLCRKFCCQGSCPRNLPVVSWKTSLPENSKQTAQQQCSCQQASQQEFFLGTKISVGNFSERFRTETCFQGIFPVGKLLCERIVERQTSCAKACAWFLQTHSDSSRQKFSHETKFALQDQKQKTFTAQNETMLLQISRCDMRWSMPKASLASMLQPCDTGRSFGRRAQAPTENCDRSNLVESPSTNKKTQSVGTRWRAFG